MTGTITIGDDRIIALAGGQNFREVGGYPARNGRAMKRGLVWRSARLDELTAQDIDLDALRSITTVADLRLAAERDRNPTPSAFAAARTTLSWDTEHLDLSRPERLFEHGLDAEGYAAAVRQFYRGLADGHRDHLAELYRHIAAGSFPILIHCSAGKDRTGIAVALLLELIGVDRAYVVADYCKTSELLDWKWLTSGAAAAGMQRAWLDQLAPQALDVLMRADQSYIMAALDELEMRHGSIEQFAREALELSLGEIESLRTNLLEK